MPVRKTIATAKVAPFVVEVNGGTDSELQTTTPGLVPSHGTTPRRLLGGDPPLTNTPASCTVSSCADPGGEERAVDSVLHQFFSILESVRR